MGYSYNITDGTFKKKADCAEYINLFANVELVINRHSDELYVISPDSIATYNLITNEWTIQKEPSFENIMLCSPHILYISEPIDALHFISTETDDANSFRYPLKTKGLQLIQSKYGCHSQQVIYDERRQ